MGRRIHLLRLAYRSVGKPFVLSVALEKSGWMAITLACWQAGMTLLGHARHLLDAAE